MLWLCSPRREIFAGEASRPSRAWMPARWEWIVYDRKWHVSIYIFCLRLSENSYYMSSLRGRRRLLLIANCRQKVNWLGFPAAVVNKVWSNWREKRWSVDDFLSPFSPPRRWLSSFVYRCEHCWKGLTSSKADGVHTQKGIFQDLLPVGGRLTQQHGKTRNISTCFLFKKL